MDATLSESEELLLDTAMRLGADLACESVADFEEYDGDRAWRALADMGLLGLRLPEAVGGGGGSTLDLALVVQALAYHLVPAPFLGSAAFVGELLLAAGAPKETLARLTSGELRLALALTEDLSTLWDGSSPSPVAFDSAGAVGALVVDASEGGRLRVAPLGAPLAGLDITRSAHRVDATGEREVGPLGGSIDASTLERVLARFLTLLSADLVGVMDAGLATAVRYAATREQFGVPIATFQAVQHICADQLISLEGARSLTEYAAWSADEVDGRAALLAGRSAKAYASRAGRNVTEAVVQVHGGMGFTWDCPAHVYLKRALLDARAFGDHSSHIASIARLRNGGEA